MTCPQVSWRLKIWGRGERVEEDHPVVTGDASSTDVSAAVGAAEALLGGLGLRVEQWYPAGPDTAYAVLSVTTENDGIETCGGRREH